MTDWGPATYTVADCKVGMLIEAAAAELERANIVARTMAGKMRAVARGGRWGGAGMGVRGAPGGGLEPCPEEQETLRAVRAALDAGSTWRQIRESVPGRTRNGVRGKVSFQVISRVQKQMDEEAGNVEVSALP